MSDLKINNITNSGGNGGTVVAGVSTVSTSAFMVMPSGNTSNRNVGSGRAVFAGGGTPSKSNVINTVQIATTGNATDFGDLSVASNGVAAVASATRGIFGGGYTPTAQSLIEFVHFESSGGVIDFGDLLEANQDQMSGSNNTIGIFSRDTTTQFITMASTGDATEWGGDTTVSRFYGMQSNCSSTRMVIGGGRVSPTVVDTIDYFTFSTRGDAVSFGQMTSARSGYGAGGNSTRGIFATEGNAQDFGDLSATTRAKQNAASSTRCVIAGGTTPTNVNTIEYVTISTTGDATDFGDLQNTPKNPASCSDVHGGLG